jgi:hypothetical protein
VEKSILAKLRHETELALLSCSWTISFSGLLGATGGRFLSMTSTAAHPTWPLRQPSCIWFPLIIWWTPASTGPIFLCLIGVISLYHIPLLPKHYLPYTHRQQTASHLGAYATPCVALVIKGISNKDTWHDTHVFDLTFFWSSQRSKHFVTIWPRMFVPLCEYLSTCHLHLYQILVRTDFKYGCQVSGGHLRIQT